MRKLQHQLRLQSQDNARLDPAQVEQHSTQVRQLWAAMFS
jgi:glutamate-ammonia-ligase adenylyltransferase